MRRLTTLLLVILVVLVAASLQDGRSARASFPGANGKIAFVSDRDGNNEIYVMNADGSGQTNLTNNPATDGAPMGAPAWSPDSRKIAFGSDRDGNFEVYVMDADGSNVVRITNDPATNGQPTWSPDGERLAFVSNRDGRPQIYAMDASGANPQRLTDSPGWDLYPAWSPRGDAIAFHSTRGDPHPDGCEPDCIFDIYTMNTDGSNVRQITADGRSTWPDWAPHGLEFAFTRGDEDGGSHIATMAADGSGVIDRLRSSSAIENLPAWAPDGSSFAYSASAINGFDIFVTRLESPAPVRLTETPGDDWFPDWQALVLGDINCDNLIGALDARILFLIVARKFEGVLSCQDHGDVNEDGRLDSIDGFLILQYDAGLIHTLPP